MLFDLDDAKKQFLHFYPLLTFNIEAPFAIKVKVIIGMAAVRAVLYIVTILIRRWIW
jgi:hypothetical protein